MSSPLSNSVPAYDFNPQSLGEGAYFSDGVKWGFGLGDGVGLTYSFPVGTATFISGYTEYDYWSEVTPAEQVSIRQALNKFSSVINVSFTEVPDTNSVVGDIRFAFSDILTPSEIAYAYLPSDGPWGGDVWFNGYDFNPSKAQLAKGSYEFLAVLHEVGHALGLKHPFEGPNIAPAALDNNFNSVMSYTASPFSAPQNNYASFYPTTLMYYDILTLQATYGRNQSHNAGDTSYTFYNNGTLYFQTLDDAGGTDTLTVAEQAGAAMLACVINLNPGQFSSFGGVIQFSGGSSSLTVCIGPETYIENAIGGSGADTLTGNFLSNALSGRIGNDILRGADGDDTVTGGGGDDTLMGGSGNDTLSAGTGNDLVKGGSGTDTALLSGAAAITASLAILGAQNTGAGFDTFDGIENLASGTGHDFLTGDALANVLSGGAGDDSLDGGMGDDTLDGSDGSDTAVFLGAAPVVADLRMSGAQDTGRGTDLLLGIENLTGGDGADVLTGDGADNRLTGGAGDDTLIGWAGNDVLSGGAGADRLSGGDGIDTADYTGTVSGITVSLADAGLNSGAAAGDSFLSVERLAGGSGHDSLSGDAGDNGLSGGVGNDTLSGADGADTLDGASGDDILDGGGGNDVLNGGLGADRAVFNGAAAVTVDLALLTVQNTGHGLDSFLDIESVTSGDGNDALRGNTLANSLIGGIGNDSLVGAGGDDDLDGGEGDDVLNGGQGNDRLVGRTGTDTAVFSGSGAAVVNLAILGAQDTARGFDTLSGIENLTGGSGADQFSGDALANRIDGDAGNDFLRGGAGDDTLIGGLGNDVLTGGTGQDSLLGGTGADEFRFNLGGGSDVIADFENGIDRIVITTGAEVFGDLTLGQIGTDTLILFADVSITLAGIDSALIGASDFIFA